MFDLNTFLPYRLIRAGQAASNAVAGRYASEFGLSVSKWRVLAHLSRQPKISINELCKHAGLDRVSTSRAITALEAGGWVTKNPDPQDKRLLVIDLTDSGAERFEALSVVALEAEQTLLKGIDSDRLASLYETLSLIEKNAEN